MTAKEIQEQYLAEALNKLDKGSSPKVRNVLPSGYIEHVRKQAATLARLIGLDNGIHYIKEALKDWPKEMEEELAKLG